MILAAGAAPASPVLHAVGTAAEWAARGQASVSVLMLHLSRLHAPGPQPHHSRVATALLEEAARPCGGRVFSLANGDLVLLVDPAQGAALAPTLSRLFRAEAPGVERLLSLWTLPDDEAAVRAAIGAEARARRRTTGPAPLGAASAVQSVLESAPLERLLRRQAGVRIAAGLIDPVFEELTLDFTALEQQTGAPVPAQSDRALDRHLAAVLDQRLPQAPHGPLRLHVNLTLAGAAAIGPMPQAGIELQVMEALADVPRFLALATRLRDAGHLVVLDGVDMAALLLLAPACWPVDLLKLDWSPRLQALPPRDDRHMRRQLDAMGPGRIVLHRAETEAALAWGLRRGISLFQGRAVDAMSAAARMPRCGHAAHCSLGQCLARAASIGPSGRAGCAAPRLLDPAVIRQAELA